MPRRLFPLFVLLLLPGLALASLQPGAAPLGAQLDLQTTAPTGRIVVKFAEASGLAMGDAGLVAADPAAAARFDALLGVVAPGSALARHFGRPAPEIEAERLAAEAATGLRLPDLNRYARIANAAPASDRDALMRVVRALLADPAVETAFLEPIAVPAALGFDAFTGAVPEWTPLPAGEREAQTPDYMGLQGYLGAPPDGVDALATAATPGADGATVQVVDVEGAWLWAHEDLPDPILDIGGHIASQSWRNHGTAVLGEIRGHDNGLGVRGITPQAGVGASSIAGQSVAEAINNAAAFLDPGDIILIELHAPGPNANGNGQYGYVCMEYWQDNFDAMLLAAATGRIVCEAAGNGQQDLDDPVYGGLFDRSVRDSGAIICGATDGGSLWPAYFTNYGSRVDLHGWGFNVVTCAYGDLQGGPEEEWYTAGFSGTSSASPIVVGSVASLQGMVEAEYGYPLTARLARDILVATGTPQENPSVHIGPRPNLGAAWALAETGIGRVEGLVSDAESGLPLAGTRVDVVDTGNFALSADDGAYAFPLLADDYLLAAGDFWHRTLELPVTVAGTQTTVVDLPLVPKPLVDVDGFVYDEQSDGLSGVRIEFLEAPLAGTLSGPGGAWTLSDVVWDGQYDDVHYELRFDGVPGHGAAWAEMGLTVGLPGGGLDYAFVQVPDADEDFEASGGGFSQSGDAVWNWGTPAAGGPEGSGFSGAKCWGVGMNGDYGDDQTGWLTSPVYDFSGEDELYLSFHFWRETEAGFDGVNVQVFKLGAWAVIEPLTRYTDAALGGLGGEGGWAGSNGGWEGAVFDISEVIGPDVRFRFEFGSDGGVIGEGFWIDDIALATSQIITAAEPATPAAAAPALAAHPNPFNPKTTIAWSLPAPGELEIAVFDVSGRRVRTLLDGRVATASGELVWDGRDGAGRAQPSGVYLARLSSARGDVSERLVLLK